MCGGAPAAEALLAVGLQPGEVAADAGRALAGLGLRTALDLRIIGGRPEALQLMAALGEAGVSLGDRSKIRLLLEDQAHLDRVVVGDRARRDDERDSGGSIAADATTRNADRQQAVLGTKGDRKADRGQNDGELSLHQRRLQAAAGDSGGMSMDTVAIVLTVLIGVLDANLPKLLSIRHEGGRHARRAGAAPAARALLYMPGGRPTRPGLSGAAHMGAHE